MIKHAFNRGINLDNCPDLVRFVDGTRLLYRARFILSLSDTRLYSCGSYRGRQAPDILQWNVRNPYDPAGCLEFVKVGNVVEFMNRVILMDCSAA